jgi:hypothetical protein
MFGTKGICVLESMTAFYQPLLAANSSDFLACSFCCSIELIEIPEFDYEIEIAAFYWLYVPLMHQKSSFLVLSR